MPRTLCTHRNVPEDMRSHNVTVPKVQALLRGIINCHQLHGWNTAGQGLAEVRSALLLATRAKFCKKSVGRCMHEYYGHAQHAGESISRPTAAAGCQAEHLRAVVSCWSFEVSSAFMPRVDQPFSPSCIRKSGSRLNLSLNLLNQCSRALVGSTS